MTFRCSSLWNINKGVERQPMEAQRTMQVYESLLSTGSASVQINLANKLMTEAEVWDCSAELAGQKGQQLCVRLQTFCA